MHRIRVGRLSESESISRFISADIFSEPQVTKAFAPTSVVSGRRTSAPNLMSASLSEDHDSNCIKTLRGSVKACLCRQKVSMSILKSGSQGTINSHALGEFRGRSLRSVSAWRKSEVEIIAFL